MSEIPITTNRTLEEIEKAIEIEKAKSEKLTEWENVDTVYEDLPKQRERGTIINKINMKSNEYENKKIEITTVSGDIYRGLAVDYTPADENTPEIESICIGEIEFFSNEIKNIKAI